MTAYDDGTNKPPEEREPSLDEMLGAVLTLIDDLVDARLTGGELVRRRERIKAKVDGRTPTSPDPASGHSHNAPAGRQSRSRHCM